MVFIGISSIFSILIVTGEISLYSLQLNLSELSKSIMTFLIVAITEEIIFRGYIQHYLMQSMNKYIALFVASVIFTALHLFNPNIDSIGIFSVFAAGLVMGTTYMITNSLWFPISMHLWWNFIQVHLGFNVSGQEAYSIITLNHFRPNILNGGAWGFEGSLLSIIALLIILLGFFFAVKKRFITVSIQEK